MAGYLSVTTISTHKLLVKLVLLVISISLASSFRVSKYVDEETFRKSLLFKRPRSYQSSCVAGGNKCYSSIHCCAGLVCATLDDYFGRNPEVPGRCVREKDLVLCLRDDDCESLNARCLALASTGQRYCVTQDIYERLQPDPPEVKWRHQTAAYYTTSHGGPGSPCEKTSDCRAPRDGATLCCQDISRARQGVKRMCSRVNAISQCL